MGDNYNAGGTAEQQIPVPDANPDDCGGHGTHVAGIVGANGGGIKGVAPAVSFGAYRVFGCAGSSSSDVIVEALERAYADGMQVINQSLGAARQWPQYPTAQASQPAGEQGCGDGRLHRQQRPAAARRPTRCSPPAPRAWART